MEQLKINIETIDSIYLEFENEDHKKIVNLQMKKDLLSGKLKYINTKDKLIDWFCNKFFNMDLEVSCEDLFIIGELNGIKLINYNL